MKRKLITLILACTMAFSLAACGSKETENTSGEAQTEGSEETSEPETVTITSLDANGEETQIEVPYRPERAALLDMACLDIIDSLGEGDCVVGSATTSLDYLQDYVTNEKIENLGTIKEADLEAVMACEPDVIFIGGRLSSSYDALNEIAPVVYLATDSEKGVVESVRSNAETIAAIFRKRRGSGRTDVRI